MIVSEANLTEGLKGFVRQESFKTGGLICVIAQGSVNLPEAMVRPINRCEWNEFVWNRAEMRSVKFINFPGESVFTLVGGTLKPTENNPRASAGEF